jgi:hypothetical protein
MDMFLQGTITAGYAICSLFFLRYWKQTKDRLFIWFSISFFVLMINRTLLAYYSNEDDSVVLYSIRLFAFVIILLAIIDKNARGASNHEEATH